MQKVDSLKAKKGVEVQNLGKKSTVQETQKKIEELFEKLKKHQYAHLFNQPLDQTNPLAAELSKNYIPLSMIDLQLKMGSHYKTTSQVA